MEVKCEKLSNRFKYVCCNNHRTASLFFERRENAHITVFFSVKFLLSVKPVLGGQPRDLGWCPLNRCVIQVSLYFDYTLVPCCLL